MVSNHTRPNDNILKTQDNKRRCRKCYYNPPNSWLMTRKTIKISNDETKLLLFCSTDCMFEWLLKNKRKKIST
jgi:hypothetical protein